MEKKLVSIVIPTIGGERRKTTLDKGIESLLSQTIPFDEILVFDNSMWQDVRTKSRFRDDDRISWRKPSRHLPDALDSWNAAVSLAKNSFVTILGDDDYATSWAHEEIQKGLQKANLVYTPVVSVNSEGKIIIHQPKNKEKIVCNDEFRHDIMYHRCKTSIMGVTFLKEDFMAVGGFKDTLIHKYGSCDYYLWSRLATQQPFVAYSEKNCFCYLSSQFVSDWVGGRRSYMELSADIVNYINLYEETMLLLGVKQEMIFANKHGKQACIDYYHTTFRIGFLLRKLVKSPCEFISLYRNILHAPISKKAKWLLPIQMIIRLITVGRKQVGVRFMREL